MLTKQAFLDKIATLNISLYHDPKDKWDKTPTHRDKKHVKIDDYLYTEWVIGGQTGGSCWDEDNNDHHYPVTASKEPDFGDIDEILLHLVPDISYLQHKRLISAVLKEDERTDREYYGNYTVYGTKKVILKDLYDKLSEMNLI